MDITRDICSWAKESGMEAAIVIGGLTKAVSQKDDPPLLGVATSKAKPLMEDFGISWMLDDLNIVGPLAGMLFHAERMEFPLLSLLPFAEGRPDRRAAAVAIEKLGEILGFEVDTRELIEAEDLERQIQQMVTAQLKSEEQESFNYM
jgi:predicted ATP-grasp superfamily ATP-dependent carboligase